MTGITRTKDLITPSLARIQSQLAAVPQGAYQTWLTNTPRRTGNARRRTTLRGNTIRADYDYAVPLDQGWSRQAPQGMLRPTLRWLRQTLRNIIRK